ncbi:hypothetical protein BPOR_0032g00310 [Botrytis porri]|uniref:Uncharacterized protein n=1 Tax=Botrytis porri TaxID=87229 RepID=A0A4Z1L3F5_9HELO|nr:hypothetical protein BPOR_0032g00310 [Botrytis porri]
MYAPPAPQQKQTKVSRYSLRFNHITIGIRNQTSIIQRERRVIDPYLHISSIVTRRKNDLHVTNTRTISGDPGGSTEFVDGLVDRTTVTRCSCFLEKN